jgi:hypothetical protein
MPELMTRLRGADPARGRTLPQPTRAAVLDRIGDEEPTPTTRAPRRRPPVRRTLLPAALVALVVTGAAVATFEVGQSPEQVKRDYSRVIHDVPLPPGYKWPGAMVMRGVVYAGRRAAIMAATAQADCAWWDYWLAAAKRRDHAAMRRAVAGQAKVFAITPRHAKGSSEDVGGLDASSVAYHRLLVADAKADRTARVAAYVDVNCRAALRSR